jgi:succinate dehydrogenase/fumarate reductase flavoprotein subunit
MLLVAEAVTLAALARRESRGAHQRDDCPLMDDEAWLLHQTLALRDGALQLGQAPVRSHRIEEVA